MWNFFRTNYWTVVIFESVSSEYGRWRYWTLSGVYVDNYFGLDCSKYSLFKCCIDWLITWEQVWAMLQVIFMFKGFHKVKHCGIYGRIIGKSSRWSAGEFLNGIAKDDLLILMMWTPITSYKDSIKKWLTYLSVPWKTLPILFKKVRPPSNSVTHLFIVTDGGQVPRK